MSMRTNWRCGSLFGIPLAIDPSWIWVMLLIGGLRGWSWSHAYPEWGTIAAYGAGAVTALLLFLSVVCHEVAHSLTARQQGFTVQSITFFLLGGFMFGGVTEVEKESQRPSQVFWVAIAGPAISLLLGGLFQGIAIASPAGGPIAIAAQQLALINWVLAGLNLIPGLPLDGGQILQAILWKITGSRLKGILITTIIGRALGWGAAIIGGLLIVSGRVGSGLMVGLMGYFLVQNAANYDRITHLQMTLLNLKVRDAMTRHFRVVDGTLTLSQFAHQYLQETDQFPIFFAATGGRYQGWVETEAMQQIERSEWDTQQVSDITRPLTEIVSVEETASLVEAIQQMEQPPLPHITVLTPTGAVAGVCNRGDILQALTQNSPFKFPEPLIQQVRESGSYPMGLDLAAIAQGATELRDLLPQKDKSSG